MIDAITYALLKGDIGQGTQEAVSDYLDEHLTNPTNPPIDTSLTIAGAAADSKETGDKITQLKEDLNDISEHNKNLIEGSLPYAISISGSKAIYGFGTAAGTTLYFHCEVGKVYTFSSSSSAINRHLLAFYDNVPAVLDETINYNGSIFDGNLVTFTAPITGVCCYYVKNSNDATILGTSQFEEGSEATSYVAPAFTAIDTKARAEAEAAKADTIELTQKILNYNVPIDNVGSCVLYSNGNLVSGQGDEYRCSKYIDITPYKRIESVQHGNGVIATIAFFDASKQYLSAISQNTATLKNVNIDLTDNAYLQAKYVVISASGWSSYGSQVYTTLVAEYDMSELVDLKNPKRYNNLLSIGDSLTNAMGGGVSGGKRWQDVILDAFGMTSFITSGAIGLTVAQYGDNSIYSAVQALTADASVNLISFWGGTNDFANNIVIGDFDTQINSETRDVTTFYGGLIACVEKILTLYPTKRFFLVGTTPRVFNASTMADHHTVTNTLGLYLSDYVDAVKKVANYFAIPFVNLLEVSGINKYNISTYLYIQTSGSTSYYLHLSDAGETLIGNILASFVRSIG